MKPSTSPAEWPAPDWARETVCMGLPPKCLLPPVRQPHCQRLSVDNTWDPWTWASILHETWPLPKRQWYNLPATSARQSKTRYQILHQNISLVHCSKTIIKKQIRIRFNFPKKVTEPLVPVLDFTWILLSDQLSFKSQFHHWLISTLGKLLNFLQSSFPHL